jgi:uncharacterized protein (DUF1499 family)
MMTLVSCSGARPKDLGVRDGHFAGCPASPNCMSSDASDPSHWVEPFAVVGDPPRAWRAARAAVLGLPRTIIVTEAPDYLHAECESAVFGFVDDLELNLRSQTGVIAIRSASRVGYSDLGVNRQRVETLRSNLAAQGIVRAASSPERP